MLESLRVLKASFKVLKVIRNDVDIMLLQYTGKVRSVATCYNTREQFTETEIKGTAGGS